jgi:hypothetical protein
MHATSHETFRTRTLRTEDGCRVRTQRPSRQRQRQVALAEQTGMRQ